MCWCNCDTCNPGWKNKTGITFAGKCFVFLTNCTPCPSCGCNCIPMADELRSVFGESDGETTTRKHDAWNGDDDEQVISEIVLGKIRAITASVREEINVLQKSGAVTGGAASSQRVNQPGGLPWFKPEHISTEKRELIIVLARAQRDRWNNDSVVMKVKYEGKHFLWQVNNKNPNFDLLIDLLGGDERKWNNASVNVQLEEDPLSGRMYPRVSSAGARSRR